MKLFNWKEYGNDIHIGSQKREYIGNMTTTEYYKNWKKKKTGNKKVTNDTKTNKQ